MEAKTAKTTTFALALACLAAIPCCGHASRSKRPASARLDIIAALNARYHRRTFEATFTYEMTEGHHPNRGTTSLSGRILVRLPLMRVDFYGPDINDNRIRHTIKSFKSITVVTKDGRVFSFDGSDILAGPVLTRLPALLGFIRLPSDVSHTRRDADEVFSVPLRTPNSAGSASYVVNNYDIKAIEITLGETIHVFRFSNIRDTQLEDSLFDLTATNWHQVPSDGLVFPIYPLLDVPLAELAD